MTDKYEDTVFDDGTEPTVRRRPDEPTVRKLPLGCDQQGRYPSATERPWPAEQFWPTDELGIPLPEKEPRWVKVAAAILGVIIAGALAAVIIVSALGTAPTGK